MTLSEVATFMTLCYQIERGIQPVTTRFTVNLTHQKFEKMELIQKVLNGEDGRHTYELCDRGEALRDLIMDVAENYCLIHELTASVKDEDKWRV